MLFSMASAKEGVSFVVLGDYGWVNSMHHAKNVFNAINNLKKKAEPESAEDFDFFVTVGDNLYPDHSRKPTDEEFDKMMSLFLFYQEEQQLILNRLVENFNSEVNKIGAELKVTSVDED